MRLVCSTACFPEDRIETAVSKAGWAGYAGVELYLPEEPFPDVEAMRARLRAEELELAAVRTGPLPRVAEGPEWEAALAAIGRAASYARELDSALLITEAPFEGTPEAVAAGLRLLDRALGALPVDVCLVNRAGTVAADPGALAEILRAAGRRRFGIALDPGQALLAGWDPLELEALPELPRCVYLNDALRGRVVPPGEGELDLPLFGERLRLAGYDGPVCLRLENADPWAVDPLVKELAEAAAGWLGIPPR
ncbi:MAG: sugar phosphate isomerase/epimerase family protein [Armatimonadota bacterium]